MQLLRCILIDLRYSLKIKKKLQCMSFELFLWFCWQKWFWYLAVQFYFLVRSSVVISLLVTVHLEDYISKIIMYHIFCRVLLILDIVTIIEIAFACSVQDRDQLSDTAQKEQFDHVPISENSSFKFLFIRRMLVM